MSKLQSITDFEVTVNNGGYRQNNSGNVFWKEYNLMIEFAFASKKLMILDD